ncbi:MAG: hypothetical protein IPP88_01735 [Betaproteobacteria bacterium]|nr:hypothetical protein [Betaproteobacteria bacterium]
MTIRCTMVLWFVLAFSHATFAQLLPRPLQDSDKFASPILTIRPKFPDREPTDIFPVEIRITGNINEAGVLTSPTFSPAEGKEKFVRAIEEVLPQWRFQPDLS